MFRSGILYPRFEVHEYTVEPHLRGHPSVRATCNGKLNIYLMISTPKEGPPFL